MLGIMTALLICFGIYFCFLGSQNKDEVLENRLLVWEDEFLEINEEVWDYEIGYIRNNDIQYYTKNKKNVFCEDGILHLKAIKDYPVDGYDWSAGSLVSRKGFVAGYGLIEAKIKYEPQKWCTAAVWSKGNSYWRDFNKAYNLGTNWPECGELDIVEYANEVRLLPGAFWYDESIQLNKSSGTGKTFEADDKWHIVGVERTDTEILFYYDRELVNCLAYDETNSELFEPIFLHLSLGITNDNTEISETEFLVDWIRYYAPESVEMCIEPTETYLDCGEWFELKPEQRRILSIEHNVDFVANSVVSWNSSDESVASCYAGVVKAKSCGTTTITAIDSYGNKAQARLCVTEQASNPVEAISLYAESNVLEYGDSMSMKVVYKPEFASNTDFTWKSSDETIACVENGVVTAMNPMGGEAKIFCCSNDSDVVGTFHLTCRALPEDCIPTDGIVTKYTKLGWNESGWKSDLDTEIILPAVGDSAKGFDYRCGLGFKQNYIDLEGNIELSTRHVFCNDGLSLNGPFTIAARILYPAGKQNTTGYIFELHDLLSERGAIRLTDNCLFVKDPSGKHTVYKQEYKVDSDISQDRAVNVVVVKSSNGNISLHVNGEKIGQTHLYGILGTIEEENCILEVGNYTIPTVFYQMFLAYNREFDEQEVNTLFEAIDLMYQ